MSKKSTAYYRALGHVMQSYAGLKDNLVKQGVLVPGSDDKYDFAKPYSFSSPSAAVVLDRNSNGRTEWKVKGERRTYHDWQQAQIAGVEGGT